MKKCKYNINEEGDHLPIINCGKKAKWEVKCEDYRTEQECIIIVCTKHKEELKDVAIEYRKIGKKGWVENEL